MKKQGFTLIELLAVIAILGIILAITVPSIVGLIEKTTREAFLLDAKMVIKSINNKLLEDNKFDVSLLNESNI
jgi:prepilin-type N-terminal cleavage/methylation domain-containing protein